MSTRHPPPPRRRFQGADSTLCRYLLAPTLLLCLALLAGCASQTIPAAPTPSPFPTFDLNDLPPPVDVTPAEVRTYLAEVAGYTTPGIISAATEFSTERLDGIVATLEGLPVPSDMIPAHETLLKGYRTIAQGRHIAVDNVGDGAQQAEARSLTDFGQLLLQEHIQIVNAYLAALRTTPVP